MAGVALEEEGHVRVVAAAGAAVQLFLQAVVGGARANHTARGVELTRIAGLAERADQLRLERRRRAVVAGPEVGEERRKVEVGPMSLRDQEPVERPVARREQAPDQA